MAMTSFGRRSHSTHGQPGVGGEFQAVITEARSAFGVVAGFSFVINLLMLTVPVYMLQLMDRVLSSGSTETLVLLTIMAGFALLIMSILDTVRTFVTVRIGGWLSNRLGPLLLQAGVQAKLAGRIDGAQSLRDLSQVQAFVATNGLLAFFDSPWVPIFVFVIWLLHPLLGAIALVTALVLLGLSVANWRLTRASSEAANMATITATQLADSTIRNAEVVQAMGLLPAMVRRWRGMHENATAGLLDAGQAGGVVMSLTKFVRFFAQVAILAAGAWLVIHQQLTAGAMIAASILLGRALAPVELAIGAWKNFQLARLAYNRMKEHVEDFPPEPARMRQPEPRGYLSVRGLSYLSKSGDAILADINFDVEPGELLAIIGPSGAGKSTLCRLLVGLDEPKLGEVRLDGTDIRHWDRLQLGKHVGFLPQDVELFSGSVRENIERMTPASDHDVVSASVTAHAHDMIQKLPKGYDTEIGDRGIRLSGGQRQRVGLARAVFGNPKLLVLDEPNANLDQAGETALGQAIAALKGRGCALIIVGHRPSTLAHADTILLMSNGTAAMFGPRDEVLAALRAPSDDENDEAEEQVASQSGAVRAISRNGKTEETGKYDVPLS